MSHPEDSQPQNELQGVYIEVPRHSMDELTAILGDFTTRNGGAILAEGVGPRDDTTEHSTKVYNERYTEIVDDEIAGEPTVAVTKTGLLRYADENGRDFSYYERAFNKFCGDPARFDGQMTAYYAHEGDTVRGLRADKLPELIARLKSRGRPDSLNLKLVSDTSIKALENISSAITLKVGDTE